MGLLRRGRGAEVRCEAVVIAVADKGAEAPIKFATVHLEVHPPGEAPFRATDSGMVRAAKEPRPGMRVPVRIGRRGNVEIEWDEVPTWEERARNGDPAASDVAGSARGRLEALHAATHRDQGHLAPGLAPHLERVRRAAMDAQAAAAEAVPTMPPAAGPAPAGRLRGVAHVTHAVEPGNPALVQQVVLTVEVPGREPYAIHRRMRLRRADVLGGGFPVLVSEDDPEDVEVLWDEVPDEGAQAARRVELGFARSEHAFGALQQQQMAQGADFARSYAQQALAQLTDPQQREAFLRAMRAAGWDV